MPVEGGAEDPIGVEGGVGEGVEDAGGDAPGEGLIGTEDVGDGGELAPEIEVGLIGMRGGVVLKAAGFDDGKEGPAEVGFGASGEGEGDDEAFGRGPNLGEEAGETGAESGGIDDEVVGMPSVAQAGPSARGEGLGDKGEGEGRCWRGFAEGGAVGEKMWVKGRPALAGAKRAAMMPAGSAVPRARRRWSLRRWERRAREASRAWQAARSGGAPGGGEAGGGEVEDDEAEEGDLLVEAGDLGGAGVVVEVAGLEFAGVEAVLEGVGVAGLPAGEAVFGLHVTRFRFHVSRSTLHVPRVAGCTLQVARVKG